LEQVTHNYETDEYAKDVIAKLVLDSASVSHFTWIDGHLLHYKNRI
jgi:hypothetical protein